jgi:hypothetical protein
MDEELRKAMAEITAKLDRILAEIEAMRVSNREWLEDIRRQCNRIR